MPTPFFDAIRRHAAASPDRPSLTVGETTLTRAELVAAVERVAAAFAERGVGERSWVTIALPNGIEFVQSALAAWLLGGTPQPISRRLPAVEREAIIALADPALVVGSGVDVAEAGGRPVLSAAGSRGRRRTRRPRGTSARLCSRPSGRSSPAAARPGARS